MQIHLKVKVCSLAAEQRIIRRLEKRLKKYGPENQKAREQFWSLRTHRKELGVIARHSHLALAFMRGRPYDTVEAKTWTLPDWDAVEKNALTFSEEDSRKVKQAFEAWRQAADTHARHQREVLRSLAPHRAAERRRRYQERNTNEARAARAATRAAE